MRARPLIAALTLLAVAATSGALAVGGEPPRDAVRNVSKSEILQVIRAAKARFSECYREAVGRRSVRTGKVTVKFTIASSGEVAAAEISGSSFDDRPFHACLLDVVRRLRFSPFRGERLIITYPLVFKEEQAGERRPPPRRLPPEEPEQPAEPDQPSEPEEPAEPEDPAEPAEPAEPAREEPTEPGEPAEPDQPSEPQEPPDEPAEPEEPPAEPDQEPEDAVRPPAPR